MNLNYLRNKSILITGGTGSFGENFIKFLLKKLPFLKEVTPSITISLLAYLKN